MPKIERIVVPVDFSPCSKAALEYGSFLAAKVGATMDVLHISPASEVRPADDVTILHRGVPGSTLEIYNEQEIQGKLTEFLKTAGIHRQVRNDEIEQGKDAAQAIVKHASEKGYDLIVMGTHGRKGFDKFFAGSVAQKVVQNAHCPVLICHSPE